MIKFITLFSLLIVSCANQTNTSSSSQKQNNSSQDESSSNQATSSSGGDSSSSGGGSSSSGGGSSSSDGQTILPNPTPPTPASDEPINFKDYSYDSNTQVLTTPIFKMKYDDSAITSGKLLPSWKESFLKEMYNEFLNSVTFGPEIFTLDKIVFKQNNATTHIDNGFASSGTYEKDRQIIVSFQYRPSLFNKYDLFQLLTHEYYHHLTLAKMGNLIRNFSDKDVTFDNYYYQNLMNLFNGYDLREKSLEDAKKWKVVSCANLDGSGGGQDPTISQHVTGFLAGLYHQEVNKWWDNKFKNNSREQFITFNEPKGITSPYLSILTRFKFTSYLSRTSELIVRAMSLMTNAFAPKIGDLYKISGSVLLDYFVFLFFRQNIYYSYQDLTRQWPRRACFESNGRTRFKEDDKPKWSDINSNVSEQTLRAMQGEHRKWKDYFENIFYNQDQLFSGAISDNDDNLFLELNAKDQVITLENVVDGTTLNLGNVKKYPKVGQITFNLKPFDKDNKKKTLLNTYLYQIKKSALPKGKYYLKIGGNYLSEGFEIKNSSTNKRTIWKRNGNDWKDPVPLYEFFIERNRVVLEVL